MFGHLFGYSLAIGFQSFIEREPLSYLGSAMAAFSMYLGLVEIGKLDANPLGLME